MAIRVLIVVGLIVAFLFIIRREWIREVHSSLKLALLFLIFLISSTLVLCLWATEIWTISLSIVYSILISLIVWVSPILMPAITKRLNLQFSPKNIREKVIKNKKNTKIFMSVFFSIYVIFGYWAVICSLDPKEFFGDFLHQLWIIPVALIFIISINRKKNERLDGSGDELTD